MKLVLDFETYSECNIKKRGAANYVRHPSTEVLNLAYSIDGSPADLWVPGDPIPTVLLDILGRDDCEVWAHNAPFDLEIYERVLRRDFPAFPEVPVERWYCSMALSLMHGLPASLANVGDALDLKVQKDPRGKKAIDFCCSPTTGGKRRERPSREQQEAARGFTDKKALREARPDVFRNATQAEVAIWFNVLDEYALDDVNTTVELIGKLRTFPEFERRVWLLDRKINDRGIPVDATLCEKALEIAEKTVETLSDELYEITDGAVQKPTNVAQIKAYLQSQGMEIDSLAKDLLSQLIAFAPNMTCRRVLEIRRDAGKTSTGKYQKALDLIGDDGRVRDCHFYFGAHTGRWAGRGVQFQNMPRGTLNGEHVESVIDMVLDNDPLLEIAAGPAMEVLSSVARGMIKATDGWMLNVVDFAQIEARVLAWLAGQEDILQGFRDKKDIYKVMASGIYGVPYDEVTKDQRFYGKTAVLGLGYGMGAELFQEWLETLGAKVTEEFASEVVQKYRTAADRIVAYWRELNDAAIAAVERPGRFVECGRVKWIKNDRWLWCVLPSGRGIAYPGAYVKPVTRVTVYQWTQPDDVDEKPTRQKIDSVKFEGHLDDTEAANASGYGRIVGASEDGRRLRSDTGYEFNVFKTSELRYLVVGQGGAMHRHASWGGLLAENVVQAISRDLLADSMLRLDAAGFSLVMHVHDEAVSEDDVTCKSLDEMETIMLHTPDWADGLPMGVDGFSAARYRK